MNYTSDSLKRMQTRAVSTYRTNKEFLKRLKRLKPNKLDNLMLDLHNGEFELINCMECANCCKTISPSIYDSDLRRIGRALKMKPAEVISHYLFPENDSEYVFRQNPCPFLNNENLCIIYDVRPKACREYPHTNRKRFYQILALTAENSKVCPAVFNIVERLKQVITNT